MAMKELTVKGLSHWASYLINGDASGLDDDEVKEADEYLDTDEMLIVRPPDYIDKDKLVKDCMMYLGLGYSYLQFIRTGNLLLIKSKQIF